METVTASPKFQVVIPKQIREKLGLSPGQLLRVLSYARPGKLFTANQDIIVSEVATLKLQSLKQVIDAVVDLLRASSSS